jgi:hypothetical protein
MNRFAMLPTDAVRCLVAFGLVICALCPFANGAELTDKHIQEAMVRMTKYLYGAQNAEDGGFGQRFNSGHHLGGETALASLALLIAGESPQNPKLAKAIAHLQTLEMNGTYAIGLRAHVWGQLSNEYKSYLIEDASWLLKAADNRSVYAYGPNTAGTTDHSCTQYGILGVWEASKRDIGINHKFWARAQQHFIKTQTPDGGWNYSGTGDAATGTMTAAGLTALFVCQQQLHRHYNQPDGKLVNAIAKGMQWLDTHFTGGPSSFPFYYLYGIERVALASGVTHLNGRHWYRDGARFIFDNFDPDSGSVGGNVVQTSFSLMFLARGRYPVWASKLLIPDAPTNRRPNDLHYLTQGLSDMIERELNWQVVRINSSPEDWVVAPVLWIVSSQSIDWTPEHVAKIRRYIDLGGMVLATPEHGSTKFIQSVRELAKMLYPQYELKQIDKSHPLLKAWHPMKYPNNRIFTLSNGARDLLLLTQADWSIAFQTDAKRRKRHVWKMAGNLFSLATGKGRLPPRLSSPYVVKAGTSADGQVDVARVQYEGHWLPEPAAWELAGNFIFNRTRFEVKLHDVAIDELADHPAAVAHLTGVDAVTLSPGQIDALRQYATRGGTLLIETVGGLGDFTPAIERQLAQVIGHQSIPLDAQSPILSGENLTSGFNNTRAQYRHFAQTHMNAGTRPRLTAYFLDDRPAIILSAEDLSTAVLGVPRWSIVGYEKTTARRFLTNITMAAAKHRQSIAAAEPAAPE